MFVKNLKDCNEFIAVDGCYIRELLHPSKDPVSLPYSLAIARITAGKKSYVHKLKQDEVYYILKGEGHMHIKNEVSKVTAGDVVVITANLPQWIENNGEEELIFAAIVSPPWTKNGDICLVDV